MRIQKTVGSTVYNYYYSDGLLVRQTWGSNYIDFLYDESGLAYSFIYNGTQYYYVKNLQGDVVAIANSTGTIVVNYTYDAWGNILSITGSSASTIGAINPIRYRSYYYDTETGFYYLQSRYYDPAIRRFINADGYVNANDDILGFNMYAYCGNNPVMYVDYGGTDSTIQDLYFTFDTMFKLFLFQALNDIGDFLGSVFGAEGSISNTSVKEKNILPSWQPIVWKTGIKQTVEESIGDSSKPISVYGNIDFDDNHSMSVTYGLNLNVGKLSLNLIEGGERGIEFSWDSKYAASVNVADGNVYFQYAETNGNDTYYTQFGLNGTFIVALALALLGSPNALAQQFGT